jgi:serine/threonine protein kinase/tetratricopeptide (TPR) repeat protein
LERSLRDLVLGGRFHLETEVGAGGMGTVYRGRDLRRGDLVAVKVVRANSLELLKRLGREAEVLSELRHPCLVSFREWGALPDGGAFIAMEWIQGIELGQQLRQAPLRLPQAIAMGLGLASALALVHSRGIIHRDIKPNNVVLREGDPSRPVLLDFGIAALANLPSGLTIAGLAIGTPGYMAPEQVRGETIDERADVYGLGCLLFHAITGTAPFVGDSAVAVVSEVLLREPPRLADRTANVPQALNDLMASLLAKDRAQRPANGAELLDRLTKLSATLGRELSTTSGVSLQERRTIAVVSLNFSGPPEEPSPPSDHLDQTVVDFDEVPQSTTRNFVSPIPGAFVPALAAQFGGAVEPRPGGHALVTFSSEASAAQAAQQAARFAVQALEFAPLCGVGVAIGPSVVGAPVDAALIEHAAALADQLGTIRTDAGVRSLLGDAFEIDFSASVFRIVRSKDSTSQRKVRGRERELSLFASTARSIAKSKVQETLVLVADAGLGRTTVLREFESREYALEQPPAFIFVAGDPVRNQPMVLTRALVQRALLAYGGSLEKALEALAADPTLAHAFPVLKLMTSREHDTPDPALRPLLLDPLLLEERVATAFADLLRQLGRRCGAVTIAIDDVQLVDSASLRVLHQSLLQLRDTGVLLLLTCNQLLDPKLRAELEPCAVMRMIPLSNSAAAAMLADQLGPEFGQSRFDDIVGVAKGHPMLLKELARQALTSPNVDLSSTNLLAAMEARVARLDPDLRRVLRAASVFEGSFWETGLLQVMGDSRDSRALLNTQLNKLAEKDFVTRLAESRHAGEIEWRFVNAVARDAAYAMLSDADKMRGHALAAEWLLRVGEKEPAILARQFAFAGEKQLAAQHWLNAANQAYFHQDHAMARTLLERVLALEPDPSVSFNAKLVLAEILFWAGHFDEALGYTAEALGYFSWGTQGWLDAMGVAARCTLRQSKTSDLSPIRAMVTAVRTNPNLAPDPRSLATLVTWCLRQQARALAVEVIEVLGAAALRNSKDDLGGKACHLRCRSWLAAADGDYADCLAFDSEAMHCAAQIGDRRLLATSLSDIGYDLMMLGAYEEAEANFRSAQELAAQVGLLPLVATIDHNLGLVLHRLGRDDEAIAMETRALSVGRGNGDHLLLAYCDHYLGQIYLDRGELDLAEQHLESAAQGQTHPELRSAVLAKLSRVAQKKGWHGLARLRLEEALRIADQLTIEEDHQLIPITQLLYFQETNDTEGFRRQLRYTLDALLQRANRIRDPQRRQSFLERVPDHRIVMDAARREGWEAELPT